MDLGIKTHKSYIPNKDANGKCHMNVTTSSVAGDGRLCFQRSGRACTPARPGPLYRHCLWCGSGTETTKPGTASPAAVPQIDMQYDVPSMEPD